MSELIAPHYALLNNHEVAVPIFLDNWTLAEVLSFALSTVVRTFTTNSIPILIVLRAILGQTMVIGCTTDLYLLRASSGNTGLLYIDIVLVATDTAVPFCARGFDIASRSSDQS